MFRVLILCFCLFFGFLSPATAGTVNTQNYRIAFGLLKAGKGDEALSLAASANDPALTFVVTGYAMALPGNGFGFYEMAHFLSTYPEWPDRKGILMLAEQKIPSNATPSQVVNWFSANPPLTLAGIYKQVDALQAQGQVGAATTVIRTQWAERSFSCNELKVFYSRFKDQLRPKDHLARLDKLLWDNNAKDVNSMAPYISAEAKKLAQTRLAFADESYKKALKVMAQLPASMQNDPGLLYEKLRYARKTNKDSAAIAILSKLPAHLTKPERWWEERNIIVRRLIEAHDFKTAYHLVSNHGLKNGSDYVDAEFLAGWLSLRFLNKASQAHEHFVNMLQVSTTPMSKARAYYWSGRTLEVLKDTREAEQAYESASVYNTVYYGQLATTRIYPSPILSIAPEPKIPETIRNAFMSKEVIQAIYNLYKAGETTRARTFFKSAADAATQRAEFVMLSDIGYQLGLPDWAIMATKAANQKGMVLGTNGYPILDFVPPPSVKPAFIHALIRQESLFNPEATSSAGAKGLMQMMPRTAREVAQKEDVRFSEESLYNPSYNVKLGTAFVRQQLDHYDDSLVLSLAAYNAGGRRVHEWIDAFGDPRSPKVDSIDWVELMPIYETRNYVQRIMENYQVYRARLNGGNAPLTILEDLRK